MAVKTVYRELSSARPSAREGASSAKRTGVRHTARPRRTSQTTPAGYGDLLAKLLGASHTLERARRR